MTEQRPFADLGELFSKAAHFWWSLEVPDWLEAFRSHPRIGETRRQRSNQSTPQNRKSGADEWSEQEQAAASNAGEDEALALAELNRKYEEKFGYLFIVCATGKSAEEMITTLRERLNNSPERELLIAAEQQARIMQLRLRKLINQ